MFTAGGFGEPNRKRRNYQDAWFAGVGQYGAILVICDGIGGGFAGAEAAQTAVNVVSQQLMHASPDESLLYQAILHAQRCLNPWFQRESGGSTIVAGVLTESRWLVGAVGDSQAYIGHPYSRLERVTFPSQEGALMDWLGSSQQISPFVAVGEVVEGMSLVLTSDGIDVADLWYHCESVDESLLQYRENGRRLKRDDATLVMAVSGKGKWA